MFGLTKDLQNLNCLYFMKVKKYINEPKNPKPKPMLKLL